MKKWLVVGILILIVGLTHLISLNESSENDPIDVELEEGGLVQTSSSAMSEQPTLTDKVTATLKETEEHEMAAETSLFEVVRSFVYFYYDWNYRYEDRSLYDYVTYDFFSYLQYELGNEHEYSHEEDELFYVQDVKIFIENLSIYEPIAESSCHFNSFDSFNSFNIIVEFDVLYDVPHHDIFGRNIILRLEIIRDDSGYLINQKIWLNNDL